MNFEKPYVLLQAPPLILCINSIVLCSTMLHQWRELIFELEQEKEISKVNMESNKLQMDNVKFEKESGKMEMESDKLEMLSVKVQMDRVKFK